MYHIKKITAVFKIQVRAAGLGWFCSKSHLNMVVFSMKFLAIGIGWFTTYFTTAVEICCGGNGTSNSLNVSCQTVTSDALGAFQDDIIEYNTVFNGRHVRALPQFINSGQHLKSRNGKWKLILQSVDGHLVLYPESGSYRWANWVLNYELPGKLRLENNGDLVVYNARERAVWRTGTNTGEPLVDVWFVIQDDGNLVLYQQRKSEPNPRAVWNSNTKSMSTDQLDNNGSCISFSAGMSGVGTWSRQMCSAGTFCSSPNGCVTCHRCPSGSQCPARGLSAAIPCPAGSHGNSYALQTEERFIPISSPTVNGYLLTTISTKPEYEFFFNIKPISVAGSWSSIIHLTASGDSGGLDARIPGVWFSPGTTQIIVFISDNSVLGVQCQGSIQSLPLNIYTSVLIRVDGMTLSTYINGILEGSCLLSARLIRTLDNVKVYLGDPWYPPAKAYVKNVTYVGFGAVTCALCPPGRWGNITGSFLPSVACPNSCRAGTSSHPGASSADMCTLPCPMGSYCDGIWGTQKCPAGRWGNSTGATSLSHGCSNVCPSGLWGNITGSTALGESCPQSCPSGMVSSNITGATSQDNACKSLPRLDCNTDADCKYNGCQCDVGEGWCTINNIQVCQVCSGGLCFSYHFAPPVCKGKLCPPKPVQSLLCPAGTFNLERSGTYLLGLTQCTPCPQGTYSERQNGSSTCVQCQPGKFTNTYGAVNEAACFFCFGQLEFQGTDNSYGVLAVGCKECLKGSYFSAEHLNHTTNSEPTRMLSGNLSWKRKLGECKPCLAGYYAVSTGSTSCNECRGTCSFPGYWELPPGCTATNDRVCEVFVNDAPQWLKYAIACGQVPLVSIVVLCFLVSVKISEIKGIPLSLFIGVWDVVSDCTTLSLIKPNNPMMIFWLSLASIMCSFTISLLLAAKSNINLPWKIKAFIFAASSAHELGQDWPEKWNHITILCLEECPQLVVQAIAIYQQGLQGFGALDWAIWAQTIFFTICNLVKNILRIYKNKIDQGDAALGIAADVVPVAGIAV